MASGLQFEDVRGKHLLVGLSGGADSVALLRMLWEEREALSLRLTAAHLNHGIRGPEAEQDARFCRKLCSELNVDYIEGRADVPRLAAEQSIGLETAARNERHSFLRKCREACGADYIALAHHMDDQAETVLMHLLRGAGTTGVSGMRRFSGCCYRPLLDVRKAFLMQYLEERRISWREDASNGISDNPRNALRLHVLPEIEKSYPRAIEAIARHAAIARLEDDFLDNLTADFLKRHLTRGPFGLRIDLEGWNPSQEALLRRAIRRVCPEELSAAKLAELIALSERPRGKTELSGAHFAEKTPSALYFLPKQSTLPAALPLAVPGKTTLSGVCHVLAEMGDFPIEPDNPQVEIMDADALEGAMLRTRRQGDRFRHLGSGGDSLLSDVLTDRKIDRPLRDALPLIAVGSRVLWCLGAGISREARIHQETTRRVRITIQLYKHTDEQTEVYQ